MGGRGRGGRCRGLGSEQGSTADADHLSGAHRRGRRARIGTRHSATAMADDIDEIVAFEGAADMTAVQAARLEQHFSEGVTRDGISR